eukprot:TRINITY_DN7157_c0_g1_i1.p1 TRINITY_DN7157_c0_g1~~TRINITY_DN7157_c0_g1_i1.p1  ORF type:complete len:606 (+),score=183.13 TRINITY_DN7157_c0_g1_i1:164-1819(+)
MVQVPTGSVMSYRIASATSNKNVIKIIAQNCEVTFDFDSRADRDALRDLLVQLIAAHGGAPTPSPQPVKSPPPASPPSPPPAPAHGRTAPPAVSKERAAAQQLLLQSDSELQLLYEQLVMRTKVLTAEEFWGSREKTVANHLAKEQQVKGMKNTLLADVRPVNEGSCNEVKYTLTKDIIRNIFLEFPAIEKAFQENVPNNLSEREFWIKYFESDHFLYHSRGGSANEVVSASRSGNDIFVKCQELEERDPLVLKRRVRGLDPLCDVAADDRFNYFEGEGCNEPLPMQSQHLNKSIGLIRHFNRHGALVVGSVDLLTPPELQGTALLPASKDDSSSSYSNLTAALGSTQGICDLSDDQHEALLTLNITNPSQYFEQSATSPQPKLGACDLTPEMQQAFAQQTREIVSRILRDGGKAPDAASVIRTFQDPQLAPSEAPEGDVAARRAALMGGADEVVAELKSVFLTDVELLHHFWGCFPTDTDAKRRKKLRVASVLEQRCREYKARREQPKAVKIKSEYKSAPAASDGDDDGLRNANLDQLIAMMEKALRRVK